MLQLLIKASSLREATACAEKYGIFLTSARLSPHPANVIAECDSKYEYECAKWFTSTQTMIDGFGYALGSLLLYTRKVHREAA